MVDESLACQILDQKPAKLTGSEQAQLRLRYINLPRPVIGLLAGLRIELLCEGWMISFARARWIKGIAGGKQNRVVAVPRGIHVASMRHQQIHHPHAFPIERSPHQRSVAALMHVGPVVDHPFRYRQPGLVRRDPWHSAFELSCLFEQTDVRPELRPTGESI